MRLRFINALLGMLVLVQGCGRESPSPAITHQAARARTLAVHAIQIPERYVTSGVVTSEHRVSVSSRLSGYIRKMSVREGDRVHSGQVLVRVDPVDARQALARARADLADAAADRDRYEELLKAHAVTHQQVEKMRLRYTLAQTRVEQAQNELAYAEVRSPLDGIVVEKRLSEGDLASPGAPILTLEDPASLLVDTYVSEQFIGGIHENDAVGVDVPALKRSFQGAVHRVVQAADPVSHQFLVKISLGAAPAPQPGMYAQVSFRTGMRAALLVPPEAIVERAGLQGVYLLDEDRIAHYRLIRLGQQAQGGREVLAGLREGDTIAWNGDPPLASGARVTGQ